MKQYPLLAIDSAASVLRVGLQTADDALITAENRDRFRHAEFILGLIDKVISEGGVHRKDIKAIAVSLGPGSFTGLRVGLATAKGLALSLDIPLVGIPLLEAVGEKIFTRFGGAAVVIPSRREEFYLALIDSDNPEHYRLQVVKSDGMKGLIGERKVFPVDCDLSALNLDPSGIIGPGEFQISIGDYLEAGRRRLALGQITELAELEPRYIQVFPAAKK